MAQETMELSRGQVNDLLAKWAAEDPEYRKALMERPREVLQAQFGVTVPESIQVKVIEEGPNEFHVIIPHVVEEGGELSDADLEQVAGGFLDKKVRCSAKQLGFASC